MAFAHVHLGLTRDGLLDTTPAYFQTLCEIHRNKVRHSELMLAQLTAVTANFSYRALKEPLKVSDFMLTRNEDEMPKRERNTAKKREVVVQKLRNMFDAWCQ